MCGQKASSIRGKHTREQVTFSLMGQEGTKGDFDACGVGVYVCICVCVGVKCWAASMLQSLCFDLGLYLCFRCVLTSLQGEAFLFCFLLLFSLSSTAECVLLNGRRQLLCDAAGHLRMTTDVMEILVFGHLREVILLRTGVAEAADVHVAKVQ